MKINRLFLFALFLMGLNFHLFSYRVAMAAPEAGPGAVGIAWEKAINAQDLEGVVKLHAPTIVAYPPDEDELKGIEAVRASYKKLLAQYTVKAKLLESWHDERGDLLTSWGRYEIHLTPKDGHGKIKSFQGRYTDVSQKVNGEWRVIADHASFGPSAMQQPD